SYSLNFVFGFDGEKRTVFSSTLEFLRRYRVPMANFYILSPHKGTPLYERMKQEGRILDENQVYRTLGNVCEIKPLNCTPRELEENVQAMYDRFYSLSSMFRRLPLPVTSSSLASWFLNFQERRMRRTGRPLGLLFDWS